MVKQKLTGKCGRSTKANTTDLVDTTVAQEVDNCVKFRNDEMAIDEPCTALENSGLKMDISHMPSKAVMDGIRNQVMEALEILHKIAGRAKGKSLFPEIDQNLHLQCVYKKPAMARPEVLYRRIILPHPLLSKDTTTICLIMRDIDKSKKARNDPDVEKEALEWSDKLREMYGITQKIVQKVITRRQLRREYKEYGAKRLLATAYDLFLVDSTVARNVLRFCGKDFHKAKKMPFIINFTRSSSVMRQIDKAYRSFTLPLSAHRTRTSLSFGNLSHSSADLVDNAMAAISGLFHYCPGGFLNVRSIYMQITSGGPTIPIYVDTESKNIVELPQPIAKHKRPEFQETFGELSTLPEGLEVAVRRDGAVRVINAETKKTVLYPTIHDESEKTDDLKPRIDPKKIIKKKKLSKRKRRLLASSKEVIKKPSFKPISKALLADKGGKNKPMAQVNRSSEIKQKKLTTQNEKRRSKKNSK